MSAREQVRYYEQSAKVRNIHDVKNKDGAVVQKKMTKDPVAGVMASYGRWSAWGVDRATALAALRQICIGRSWPYDPNHSV